MVKSCDVLYELYEVEDVAFSSELCAVEPCKILRFNLRLDGVPLEEELLSALSLYCEPSLTSAELSFCTSEADQFHIFGLSRLNRL